MRDFSPGIVILTTPHMRFGKTYEAAFAATGANLPPPPYKALKKKLKQTLNHAAYGHEQAQDFFRFLHSALVQVDRKWQRAAHSVILAHEFAASAPRAAATLASIVPARAKASFNDPQERAKSLQAYAQLAREALRKIIKKFNRHCAWRLQFLVQMHHPTGLGFVCGALRTQVELLARGESDSVECPVCLDTLYQPVAPKACGHAMCRPCHKKLVAEQHSASCPICRGPAAQAKAMPVLGALAKAVDPLGVRTRSQAEAEARKQKYAIAMLLVDGRRRWMDLTNGQVGGADALTIDHALTALTF